MSKTITWQKLEKLVQQVAQAKFNAIARAESIAGVKCDCVLNLDDGSAVIVEITKQTSIDKLRTDISKFSVVRPYFISKNIFPRCFFITLEEPTPALIEAGSSQHVTVQSIKQFIDSATGLRGYSTLRERQAFGSAINLYSGEPDTNKYVNVNYYSDIGASYSVNDICEEILSGKTIVLIGDYGSGKSRCVKEVFTKITEAKNNHYKHPIAINLRDNWGLKRSTEIITRHFTDIGLQDSVADFIKVASSPHTLYLLDGFDEIGAQTWSDEPAKLVDIRKQSLSGIKDLVLNARGGILITGREHYFNNDVELIECLGLTSKNILILRCNQELTDSQFLELIGQSSTELPQWIPKKPLIAAIVRELESSVLDKMFDSSSGQIDFWDLLLNTLCEREAKISSILDANIIRALYSKIGRLSRMTVTNLGPISIRAINEAFESVTGRPPTDESAIILQRLPGLGRIGAESLDRQFVDSYILDGLKAQDVIEIYSASETDVLSENWKHPLEAFGVFYLAAWMQSVNQVQGILAFVKRNRETPNRVLLSDMVSALFHTDETIDFGNIEFHEGRFFQISFTDTRAKNFNFVDCSFDSVDLTDADCESIFIKECAISRVSGITSAKHVPPWVTNCLFEEFQSVNTLAAIREAGLSVSQTFLLSSLRKLFLQPGAGRRESSMYKGYGDSVTKKTCDKVITLLIKEKFCQKVKGATENLYLPNRSLTGRVQGIMHMMTQSNDELWTKASRIS